MAHARVEAAEDVLDKEFPVLDKGFVRLVDYLGSDERIVQSARVSYGEGTKSFRQNKGLINYLLRNDHTSPFEQVNFTFHLKMPIFVARQWIRHRTARINEISGRYSIMEPEFYLPEGTDIAAQSDDNKQGRSDEPVSEELQKQIIESLRSEQQSIYEHYASMIEKGIARELARINLPLSLYTQFYWQMDLHNLFHFVHLRMDRHAQKEIRAFAEVVFSLASKVCPIACEAFEQHIDGSVRFSRSEMEALRAKLEGRENPLTGRALERFEEKLSIRNDSQDPYR